MAISWYADAKGGMDGAIVRSHGLTVSPRAMIARA
jgi:hypothetical protein